MRIGIIGDALDRQYAGIHYYTKNLIKALAKIDNKNQYFVFRQNSDDTIDSVKNVVIPHRKLLFYRSIRLLFLIPGKARDLNLDIMIEPAHFGPFNLPSKIKRVTVIHDLTPILYRKWHSFLSGFIQKLFLPGIVSKADLVITNSEYTKADIINHLNIQEDSIVVAHLGITDLFKPTEKPETLGEYGIYKDYILYLGTIEPRKNLINLIKGYELYRHKHPKSDIQLIIAGKEGWKAKNVIKKKYDSFYRDDIILLGYVDRNDMPALYSGARAFVYPSFYEGFGLPVLEAMACGTKVITSCFSSLPEVGGPYATYFDPHDIQDISSVLGSAVHQPNNHRLAQINYAQSKTWDLTARKILDALEAL